MRYVGRIWSNTKKTHLKHYVVRGMYSESISIEIIDTYVDKAEYYTLPQDIEQVKALVNSVMGIFWFEPNKTIALLSFSADEVKLTQGLDLVGIKTKQYHFQKVNKAGFALAYPVDMYRPLGDKLSIFYIIWGMPIDTIQVTSVLHLLTHHSTVIKLDDKDNTVSLAIKHHSDKSKVKVVTLTFKFLTREAKSVVNRAIDKFLYQEVKW